ncbi:glutathione S-transferase T3-like [Brassica napus]|uniref:glutathione S-transferase T3-like n=1 Tax=Brassica napus TaxID=3708 RepID=UPI0006AABB74|nr:glutathione S-transferase T3-like [Brassica napus]
MSFQPSPDLGGSGSRAEIGEDRKQRSKWSTAEDLVLISAWLNTSKDAVVGNEQRAGTFWLRITSYYNASPKVVGLAKREQNKCKQRWGKINEGVCKFVGCYDTATKQRTSGQSEDDVLKAALEIFFNDYKVKFELEHA